MSIIAARSSAQHRVSRPLAGGRLIDGTPSRDPGQHHTALQNPDATVAEIRDALLIEAGYPPIS